jgi:hypothetical protein
MGAMQTAKIETWKRRPQWDTRFHPPGLQFSENPLDAAAHCSPPTATPPRNFAAASRLYPHKFKWKGKGQAVQIVEKRATVVAGGNGALQSAEHVFDFVPLAIESRIA